MSVVLMLNCWTFDSYCRRATALVVLLLAVLAIVLRVVILLDRLVSLLDRLSLLSDSICFLFGLVDTAIGLRVS